MPASTLGRYGALILLSASVAGCSSIVPDFLSSGPSGSGTQVSRGECSWNPRSCIHEGSYETNERAYAEQEAARLNQAALERLRRNSAMLQR